MKKRRSKQRLFQRKRSKDRGAAILELAIIVPLLVVLTIGMLESGVLWQESSKMARVTNQAARTVSSLGTNVFADRQALTVIEAAMSSSSRTVFDTQRGDKVIIYNARTSFGEISELRNSPPVECLQQQYVEGGPATFHLPNCSVYFYTITETERGFPEVESWDGDISNAPTSCATAGLEEPYWCTTQGSRGWFTSEQNKTPPAVGVYVQVTYIPLTRIFGGITIAKNAVYQMEPCAVVTSSDGNVSSFCEA